MSRFFAGGSDSESDSDSDREQVVARPQAPTFTVSITRLDWQISNQFQS